MKCLLPELSNRPCLNLSLKQRKDLEKQRPGQTTDEDFQKALHSDEAIRNSWQNIAGEDSKEPSANMPTREDMGKIIQTLFPEVSLAHC